MEQLALISDGVETVRYLGGRNVESVEKLLKNQSMCVNVYAVYMVVLSFKVVLCY